MLSAALKSAIKTRLPRGLNLGPAVVQLFLNDGRRTRLGVANFPSFFAPIDASEYFYSLRAFGPEGQEIGQGKIRVPAYGSSNVDLDSLFNSELPAWGMVAVRIQPSGFFSLHDRHLGRIRPHFFTLYADRRMESMGLVHAQTNLDAAPAPHQRWLSNLQIEPGAVAKLEVFQVNPSRAAVDSDVFLEDEQGNVLARNSARIAARGTRRAVFELAEYAERKKCISVGLQGLAAANGKPILFLHFADRSFTCCHA